MKAITSIDGKDISSSNIDDISYTSDRKGWKLLAQGTITITVPANSGVLTFTIPNLPDNGVGIVYATDTSFSPNTIYQLPKSNIDTVKDFPEIEAYSLPNSIVIKTKDSFFGVTQVIPISYLWMEKE